jgi:3-methyladenine DNA glycosylase AlkD
MNKLAEKIKNDLKKAGKPCSERDREFVIRYLGTKRKFLNVKSPDRDRIVRVVKKQIEGIDASEIRSMLDDLILSDTCDYINFAGKLLAVSKAAKESINFDDIERWISPTTGWMECDCICQTLYGEDDVLQNWERWEKIINKFAKSKNIQLRRASLVLQCKPARESSDPKLRKLAYDTVVRLMSEREILITKAISWLLRAVSNRNKTEIKKYLIQNKQTLPAIAYRETMKKIVTGKKTK